MRRSAEGLPVRRGAPPFFVHLFHHIFFIYDLYICLLFHELIDLLSFPLRTPQEILDTSDMLCTCELPSTEGCYGSLEGVAEEEGATLGVVETTSLAECKRRCDGRQSCESFALCPQWEKCFLKRKAFTGSEPAKTNGDCKTGVRDETS